MDHVFAQMWQRRTNTCDCYDDMMLFSGCPHLPSLLHLYSIFEGLSAQSSIANFCEIVVYARLIAQISSSHVFLI